MQFKDVPEGQVFQYEDVSFTKIAKVKVSCCKSANAVKVGEPKVKILIKDNQEVVYEGQ